MSKQVKIIYATLNTFALPGIAVFFLYIAFYLQFLAALHQNELFINLTYVLAGFLCISLLFSLISGWMLALQKVRSRKYVWHTVLWFPWVLAGVIIVAVAGLVLFRSIL